MKSNGRIVAKLHTCYTVVSAFQVLFRPLHTLILQLKIGETRLSCKLLSRPILLSSSLYRKPKKSTDSHEAGIPWSRFSTPFKTTLLLTKRGISSFKKNYLSSSSFGLDPRRRVWRLLLFIPKTDPHTTLT